MNCRFVSHVIVVLLGLWSILGSGVVAAQKATTERGLQRMSITDRTGREVGLYTGSFALVIGVSEYTHWPDLPGVARDVNQVRETLEARGFGVTVVRDPTRSELNQAFDEFIHTHGLRLDHRVLIYFAGHGHTLPSPYGDLNMGYIVPSDAPIPPSNPEDFAGEFIAGAMDMEQIRSYARRILAKHALFLFDSCFSGSIFTLTRAIPTHISTKTAQPVRQFITAGAEDEEVPDESVFRQQFVLALQGEADSDQDGYVTGTELGTFLQEQVKRYSEDTQHPQYGKLRDQYLNKGDFVFPLPRDPEQERWNTIKDSTRLVDFKTFLNDFPNGRFANDAQGKLAQLEEERWNTIEDSTRLVDFKTFLNDFPNGRFAKDAQGKLAQLEEERWNGIEDSTRPVDFKTFLNDFPNSRFADDARLILDQLEQVLTCNAHLQANWLTSAADCYQGVLAQDPNYAPAIAGLGRVAERYHEMAKEALQKAQHHVQPYEDALRLAQSNVDKLQQVNAEHPAISALQASLNRLRPTDGKQIELLRANVARLEQATRQKDRALQQEQEQVAELVREAQLKDQALQQLREQVAELERVVRAEEEKRKWNEIKQSTCMSDFEAFRDAYPNGRFANEALQKWQAFLPEARRWGAIKTSVQASDFRTFLATYPAGCFAEDAHRKLRQVQNVWHDPVTGMNFVHIPAGCFQMGSPPGEAGRYSDEGPQREVCVDSFWMGETEITNAQYRRFKREHDSGSSEGRSLNGDAHPAIRVSWNQARSYANWLSRRSEHTFSLPTEAEWEYACRAGTRTARYWGEPPDAACRYGNVNDQTLRGLHNCKDDWAATAPVGHYAANAFGLHDMLGNVAEWVQDTHERHPDQRVVRGGNAWSETRQVRCAFRNRNTPEPDDNKPVAGFRLRMTKKAQPLQREQQRRTEQPRPREEARNREAQKSRLKTLLPMVRVQGGTFTMGCTPEQDGYDGDCYGDEKPAHQVRVRSFEIGKYEVTQELWEAVMGDNPSHFKGCTQCPVENVSWHDVQEFLDKLNTLTGQWYRLPTEAEWEYAARGGRQSRGYKYAGSNDVGSVGWFGNNSGSKIHPVGRKRANELGLHDMSGNVWEWVQDCWNDSYAGAPTDGRAWERDGCNHHVARGGAWYTFPRLLRAAMRDGYSTGRCGFRLAGTLVP